MFVVLALQLYIILILILLQVFNHATIINLNAKRSSMDVYLPYIHFYLRLPS